MTQTEEIRIIRKTNCKWRDTNYIVDRNDARAIGKKELESSTSELKVKDAVKVKYGSHWYNDEMTTDY